MIPPVHLALLHALASQPAAEELGAADLAPVFNLANKLRDTLRCEPVAPGSDVPAEQRAAASEYAYIAGMYALAASRYPTTITRGDRDGQVDDLLLDAAAAYGRAHRRAHASAPRPRLQHLPIALAAVLTGIVDLPIFSERRDHRPDRALTCVVRREPLQAALLGRAGDVLIDLPGADPGHEPGVALHLRHTVRP